MNHLILWCPFNVSLLWVSNIHYIKVIQWDSYCEFPVLSFCLKRWENYDKLHCFYLWETLHPSNPMVIVLFKSQLPKICRSIFLFFSQHVNHWILCKKTLTKNFQQSFSCVIYIKFYAIQIFFEWYWYMVPILVVYKNFNVNTTHYFIPCLIYVFFFLNYDKYYRNLLRGSLKKWLLLRYLLERKKLLPNEHFVRSIMHGRK